MAVIATKKATQKATQKKKCPICGKEKSISNGFYKSSSPLFSLDGCVPICITCVKNEVVNDDGTVNQKKLKRMCQRLDKPFYLDDLDSAFKQCSREHGYLSDDEIAKKGKEIIGFYFKNVMLRQNRNKSFADSEKDEFVHQNSNKTNGEISEIRRVFDDDINTSTTNPTPTPIIKEEKEELVYSDKWLGDYSEKDIEYLDKYYDGLNRDYKILTENHRDYARKIAKASLQMDKSFNDMINGVEGADIKYKNAREAFDTLSKSAKFSESTRSVNDVGISSFSKITEMVENHNWIPEHKPIKKDEIDKLLDYLSTITKSL